MKHPLKNASIEAIINSLPGIIWFKNTDLEYVIGNENLKNFARFPSEHYIVGRDDYNLPWDKYADAYREGDAEILKGNTLTFLHPARLYTGAEVVIITKKSPVFDQSKNIIGISGSISMVATSECVQTILKLNHIDHNISEHNSQPIQYILSENFDKYNLSNREAICLFYLIRGKTAKEISLILTLSIRTVEKHIDHIRQKLHCSSKSEIISKAISLGFIYIIPSAFLMGHVNK